MLITHRFAGAMLAAALLVGLPFGIHAAAADMPCAVEGVPASADGCCGEAGGALPACSPDCAAASVAMPSGPTPRTTLSQHDSPMHPNPGSRSSHSGPPDTAPPKTS